MQVIGIVRLGPGRVGYFDELTRIHLTLASPEKPVFNSMNTTNLKKAVKFGSLKLVSGTLDVSEANSKLKTEVPVEVKEPEKIEDVKVAEPDPVIEEVIEGVVEVDEADQGNATENEEEQHGSGDDEQQPEEIKVEDKEKEEKKVVENKSSKRKKKK